MDIRAGCILNETGINGTAVNEQVAKLVVEL
jgi:hypothetical protein